MAELDFGESKRQALFAGSAPLPAAAQKFLREVESIVPYHAISLILDSFARAGKR
jgi:hypothetical protein